MNRRLFALTLFALGCAEPASAIPMPIAPEPPSVEAPAPSPPIAEAIVEDAPGEATPGEATPGEATPGEAGHAPAPPTFELHLRHGETLFHLARWSGLTVEKIAEHNGLALTATLDAGQPLGLPIDEAAAATLAERRAAFARRRLDRYLERRGGLVDVRTYTMSTGDTVWSVARKHGRLPLWIVAAFNEKRDLDRLGVGDEILLPVVGDAVALAR